MSRQKLYTIKNPYCWLRESFLQWTVHTYSYLYTSSIVPATSTANLFFSYSARYRFRTLPTLNSICRGHLLFRTLHLQYCLLTLPTPYISLVISNFLLCKVSQRPVLWQPRKRPEISLIPHSAQHRLRRVTNHPYINKVLYLFLICHRYATLSLYIVTSVHVRDTFPTSCIAIVLYLLSPTMCIIVSLHCHLHIFQQYFLQYTSLSPYIADSVYFSSTYYFLFYGVDYCFFTLLTPYISAASTISYSVQYFHRWAHLLIKQSSITVYCLPTKENKFPFSPFRIFIY